MRVLDMNGLGREWQETDESYSDLHPHSAARRAWITLDSTVQSMLRRHQGAANLKGHLTIARRLPQGNGVDGRHFVVLFEHSYGEPSKWNNPYDLVAHLKADLTGRTGLDSRAVIQDQPELRLPDDVEWYGSTLHAVAAVDDDSTREPEEFIASFSGAKQPVDHAISAIAGATAAGVRYIELLVQQDLVNAR